MKYVHQEKLGIFLQLACKQLISNKNYIFI